MRVWSPGPFLPTWPEPPGAVDLGVRMREQCFTGSFIAGVVREGVRHALGRALEGGRLDDAAEHLTALLHTWPVAAMVEPARDRWTSSPDGAALVVLARAADLIVLGCGWSALPGTPWPLPDADWVRAQADGARTVCGRGGSDGADEVAAALGLEVEPGPAPDTGPVVDVAGEHVAARRAQLGRALATGELAAVRLTSPVPLDPSSQLALGELRLEGRSQLALERYGLAGLLVGAVPDWDDMLHAAPPGMTGPVLRRSCEPMILPGTPARLRRGQFEDTGWLAWPSASRPVAVDPVAVHVLRALDGERGTDALADALGAPPDQLAEVLDQLVAIGAATAA